LQALFNSLAQEIYALLKLYTQYQHYLNYLQLYNIPVKEASTPITVEGGLSSTTISRYVYALSNNCCIPTWDQHLFFYEHKTRTYTTLLFTVVSDLNWMVHFVFLLFF